MTYVVIGIAGLVVVVAGVILATLGYDVGGFVGASGTVLTAIGLIGFGLTKRREKQRLEPKDAMSPAIAADLTEILLNVTRLLVDQRYGQSQESAPATTSSPGRRRIGRAEFEAAIKSALSPNLVEGAMRVGRERGALSPDELSDYFIQQRELVAQNAAGLKRLSELGASAETIADVASAGPDQESLAQAIDARIREPQPAATRANREFPEDIIQAGWDASCEPVSESLSAPFGRGVILSIGGDENDERDLRCVVTGPDGTRYESTKRLEGFRGPSSSDRRHWPGEFRPKPQEPWAPGYYAYTWIGDTPNIFDAESEVLARRFFHIDTDGIITCHRETRRAEPSEEAAPGWRATNELRRDHKYGPGVTLSIRSEGAKFGYFICKVTNPLGAVATARPRTGGILLPAIAQSEVGIHYPGQFKGAIPVMPSGKYIVEWYGEAGIRPDDATVFLARLTFNLPDGYVFR